jgi:hypothetical protein
MFDKLAFTPLDLPRYDIDYEELHSLVQLHGKTHQPYPELWHSYTVCGRMKDFDNAWECDDCWNKRYEPDGEVKFNPHTPDHINIIFKKLLDNLPYKRYTFAQILSQKKNVPPHQDGLYDVAKSVRNAVYEGAVDFNGEPEPAGLKIMLSHRDVKSFYVMKTPGSKKQFIKLPDDTSSFAINERSFWHGARKPPTQKYILSTFGIIDQKKHKELVERSYQKYYDYAILF